MLCTYKPAKLNRRMTLQSVARSTDGQGGYTETWSLVGYLWASIEPAKGYERMQAGQMQTPVTHRVLIRYRDDVTTKNRLLFGGRIFNIKEVINLEEENLYLRLLCMETN